MYLNLIIETRNILVCVLGHMLRNCDCPDLSSMSANPVGRWIKVRLHNTTGGNFPGKRVRNKDISVKRRKRNEKSDIQTALKLWCNFLNIGLTDTPSTAHYNSSFLKAFVWLWLPWIQKVEKALSQPAQGHILLLLMRILIICQKVNKGQ